MSLLVVSGLGLTLFPSASATAIEPPIVNQAAATFRPPHSDRGFDSDGDGKFEYLLLEVNVSVTVAGFYRVEGYLSDPPPITFFLYSAGEPFLDVGPQSILLAYDGPAVNATGVDGPYTVELFLSDATTLQELANDSYFTRAYSHLDFEAPMGTLAPPFTETLIDADGDGRFNFLAVDVGIAVSVPRAFSLLGQLFDRAGSVSLGSFNESFLDVGVQTLRLSFSGARLNTSAVDGPYIVVLYLFDTASGILQDTDFFGTLPYDHRVFEELPRITSPIAAVRPTIDGRLEIGEWDDAHAASFLQVPANDLAGFLLVKSDERFLYVAYDVVGDTSPDTGDVAAIAFDTDNDGAPTNGADDEFIEGGPGAIQQFHLVFADVFSFWTLEDGPYDPSLPDHEGLASARGFSPSNRSSTFHRGYEFAIPLALLEAAPGDTLGFFGGSHYTPAVFDGSSSRLSVWPENEGRPSPLDAYADLFLTPDLAPPSLALLAPQAGNVFGAADVNVAWEASDEGFGLKSIEVRLDGAAPATLPANATSYELVNVADGVHLVTVTAEDLAGNPTSVSTTFTVDTTDPTIALGAPASGSIVTSSSVRVSWSTTDAVSGIAQVEIAVDGGSPQVLPGDATEATISNLSDGPHTVTVTVHDNAGNFATDSSTFRVDTAVLSPTGPYGALLIIAIILAAAAGGVLAFLLIRRRRPPPSEGPPPSPPEIQGPPLAGPPPPPPPPEVPPAQPPAQPNPELPPPP